MYNLHFDLNEDAILVSSIVKAEAGSRPFEAETGEDDCDTPHRDLMSAHA